jgi:hypothetical protein
MCRRLERGRGRERRTKYHIGNRLWLQAYQPAGNETVPQLGNPKVDP